MIRVFRRVWRRSAVALAALVALGVLLNGPQLGSKSSKPSAPKSAETTTGLEQSGVVPSSSPNPAPNPGSDQPAQGDGRVRTGTAEEGCFQDKFDYIEAWNRTGVEPEPCFVAPPPNNQAQPDDVKRSQDGKPF